MSSLPRREEFDEILPMILAEAQRYLAEVDELPVRSPGQAEALKSLTGSLPERGVGAAAALGTLLERSRDAVSATTGPRCFHFVMGGTTPASVAADWLASVYDQLGYTWVASPLSVQLERLALDWLKQLFELPDELFGIMVTGATMSNYVSLAAARQWWGERQDVDVSEQGMNGLPRVPVFSSGHVHASAVKVLSMLGLGRSAVTKLSVDARGNLDLPALRRELRALEGRPAILIANAGEVNCGEFDPIEEMADLAEEHDAWLHVDGAFGLFARVSPRTRHLAAGAERADSITVDGHKWLNIPYDCGFAFVRRPELLARAFTYEAAYLPEPDAERLTIGAFGPESSRRARGMTTWATLLAHGREGYRELVEGHLDLAQYLAELVDSHPKLERLAEVQLNIVCFRYNPGDLADGRLDELNEELGAAILEDGRVLAGTTLFEGKVALRPAISNWRTRREDLDAFVDVVSELGDGLRER
ncbi:MAG: pyridoxal-dependent decarboxylase [Acidobacteriota bacterium]